MYSAQGWRTVMFKSRAMNMYWWTKGPRLCTNIPTWRPAHFILHIIQARITPTIEKFAFKWILQEKRCTSSQHISKTLTFRVPVDWIWVLPLIIWETVGESSVLKASMRLMQFGRKRTIMIKESREADIHLINLFQWSGWFILMNVFIYSNFMTPFDFFF